MHVVAPTPVLAPVHCAGVHCAPGSDNAQTVAVGDVRIEIGPEAGAHTPESLCFT